MTIKPKCTFLPYLYAAAFVSPLSGDDLSAYAKAGIRRRVLQETSMDTGCKRSPGLGRLSDESSFENFRDEDVLDEAVGGILSAGRKFLPHPNRLQSSATAPASLRPILKPTGHAVPGQLKAFNKGVKKPMNQHG